MDWKEKNKILSDWPSQSPDLNPIEHIWAKLKQWVIEHYPDLFEMGKTEEAYQALYDALNEGWDQMKQSLIDGLIKSIDTKVEMCRFIKGWHICFSIREILEFYKFRLKLIINEQFYQV